MTEGKQSEEPKLPEHSIDSTVNGSTDESSGNGLLENTENQADFLEAIKRFVNSKDDPVVDQKTAKIKVLEFINLLESQAQGEKAPDPQLIISEIREFSKNFNGEQPLDDQTRNKVCSLVQKVVELDLDNLRLRKETQSEDLRVVREFIQSAEQRSRELGLERVAKAVEEETAGLVTLLYRIERLMYKKNQSSKLKELRGLAESLDTAQESLFLGKPNIRLARKIRIEAERVVCKYEHPMYWLAINRFKDAYHSESTPLKVLYGLIFAFTINLILITGISLIGFLAYLACILGPGGNESIELLATQTNDTRIELEKSRANLAIARQNLDDLKKTEKDAQQKSPTTSPGINQLLGKEQVSLAEISIKEKAAEAEKQKLTWDNTQIKLNAARKREKNLVGLGGLKQLVWVTVAGTLGSIISILIRIEDFQDKKYLDPATPFLIGGFKPVIGAAFAVLFFSLINSKLVVIPSVDYEFSAVARSSTNNSNQPTSTDKPERNDSAKEFFIFAIAFVVGFSERLGKDAISRLENTISREDESKPEDRPSNTRKNL